MKTLKQRANRLAQNGTEAVHTLSRIASDEDAPAEARVSAATAILEFMYRSVEQDILVRIEKLEQDRGKR
jgi:hypothetical protein